MLSSNKRPTAYVVVDAIPRSAVGKIDKVSLRAAHELNIGSNR